MKQGFISLKLSETLDFVKFAIKCVPETFHSHLPDSFKYYFSRGETLANMYCVRPTAKILLFRLSVTKLTLSLFIESSIF